MFLFGKKDYFKPREDGVEPVVAFVGKSENVPVYEVPAVVGRDKGQADVVIGDATVSRKHFYIGTYDEKLTVTDQGSTGGTVINGETLEPGVPYFLSEGDKVKIGKLNFVCHINHNRMGKKLKLPTFIERDTAADTSEMNKADIVEPTSAPVYEPVSEPVIKLMKDPELDEPSEESEPSADPVTELEEMGLEFGEDEESTDEAAQESTEDQGEPEVFDDSMEEPESAAAEDVPVTDVDGPEATGAAVPDDTIINEHARAGKIKFVYYSGHTAVETFEVTATPFVIGRARSDYVPGAAGVSRRHCFIDRTGSTYFITDLESTNGVWINGRKIKPYNRTALENGDIIGIGDRVYKVEVQ